LQVSGPIKEYDDGRRMPRSLCSPREGSALVSEKHGMSSLFDTGRIRNLEIPNRFVRSATADYLDDDRGFVTPRKIDLYARLADGGIGLIITGTATVYHLPGLRWPGTSYITEEDSIPHFRKLTEAVHDRG
jgi:2,4-dienoyl-CoA reductase-like NADH-dependent reductase (Old Yellow Enzyme family)